MSRHGDVTREWADGEYTFRLPLGEIRKLQERCDAGPYEILKRLAGGRWRIDEVRETIRLGLQAGGSCVTGSNAIDDGRIRRLLDDYVDNRPLLQSVALAVAILNAALSGAPDETLPKQGAAREEAQSFPTESSPSLPSTDGLLSSATRPGKSTRSRSGSSKPASPGRSLRTVAARGPKPQAEKNITT